MSRWKRRRAHARSAVIASLASLAAVATLAAPAAAEVKVVCSLNADVKASDKQDPTIGFRFVGGQGKFRLQDLASICKGDTNKDGLPEVIQANIRAEGWYDNPVCGNLKMLGEVVNVISGSQKLVMALLGRKFAIQLIGGIGAWKWHGPTAKPAIPADKEDPASDDKHNPYGEKDYTFAGTLIEGLPLTKQGLPNLERGECAKAISVTGSILVHFEA